MILLVSICIRLCPSVSLKMFSPELNHVFCIWSGRVVWIGQRQFYAWMTFGQNDSPVTLLLLFKLVDIQGVPKRCLSFNINARDTNKIANTYCKLKKLHDLSRLSI